MSTTQKSGEQMEYGDYAICYNCEHHNFQKNWCEHHAEKKNPLQGACGKGKLTHIPIVEVKELIKGYAKEQRKKEIAATKLSFSGLRVDNYLQNVQQFGKIQPFFYDNIKIFWFWNETKYKYEMVDETDIMISLEKHLEFNGQTINTSTKNQYLEAFKRVGRQERPKDAPAKWIQFKDKAFSITSKELYDVTPTYFFTNPISWELGLVEDTPIMDKLFTEWVGIKYVQTLYEIIAYCCYRGYPIQTLFCLYGSGRNGKTQFLKIINKFLGAENVCSTELDTLLDSRFEAFKLYKKLVCSLGETNFGVLKKTSLLKKLVGGDLIGYEKKGKDPFDEYNYSKIIIGSNSLPSSDDTSEGFYRRWLIIDFPNRFPEGKDIVDIIPDVEYSNLALKVTNILPELLERGQFLNQGEVEERKERYILASNPLPIFVRQCCNLDDTAFVSYNQLYTAYVKFLIVNRRRKVKMGEFKDSLDTEGFYIEKTSKKVSDDNDDGNAWISGRWVNGLCLKFDWEKHCDICDICDLNSYSFSTHEKANENQGKIVTKVTKTPLKYGKTYIGIEEPILEEDVK